MLAKIGKKYGRKTYGCLRDLIRELEFEPDKKGEALRGQLQGLHALHYSRFRVIYVIDDNGPQVVVVAAGWHEAGSRRDIYQIVSNLVEAGSVEEALARLLDRS